MTVKLNTLRALVSAVLFLLIAAGCQKMNNIAPGEVHTSDGLRATLWPAVESKVTQDAAIEQKIDLLLARMTLEEKVGQMIQPEIKQVTPEDVRQYHLGSVLNGGGTTPDNNKYAAVEDWVSLADSYWQASMDTQDGHTAIPIIWGTDAVHGLGNVIGATLFPHNIGLGAAHNPELIRKVGEVTAREIAVTGLDWNFSPTVAVARDDRWGRTYESYSEDPELIRRYASAMVEGLQGRAASEIFLNETHVIATAKHFIGDGGTRHGIDRGETVASEEQLRDIHGAGYFSAVEAGVQAVMASFTGWNGERMHGHKYLLTDVLKDRMGFDGLVVGDWSGHGFVAGCTSVSCPQAINAGLDIFMIPEPQWKDLFRNTVKEARAGKIPIERIDDAVRRILRVKLRAGLFEKGAPSTRALAGKKDVLGSPEHRAVARQVVRESLVMLKNHGNLLPLSPGMTVLVAGDGADNIGKQTGGWSISWQGTGNSNADFPGGTSIFGGIEQVVAAAGGRAILSEKGSFTTKPDVAIVVYGEDPYAEMQGDRLNVVYSPGDSTDLDLLKRLKRRGIPVVSVFLTGRPLWVNPHLNASDAFVVAWLPGTEGQGIADVLFTTAAGNVNHEMKGRLSFSWPKRPDQVPINRGDAGYDPLFPYGYGLRYGEPDTLGDDLSEEGLAIVETQDELDLFKLRPQKPWQIELTGGKNEQMRMTGSTASVSTVAVSAVDKAVQHDARRVLWQGQGSGAVALSSADRQDLTSYLKANGVLAFALNVHNPPSDQALLRIGCGSYCHSDVDITEMLRNAAGKGWHRVKVDLSCFPESSTTFGLDPMAPEEYFASVYEPFKLITAGTLDMTFADVAIQKQTADEATINCQ